MIKIVHSYVGGCLDFPSFRGNHYLTNSNGSSGLGDLPETQTFLTLTDDRSHHDYDESDQRWSWLLIITVMKYTYLYLGIMRNTCQEGLQSRKNVNMFANVVHERYFWSGNPNGKHTHQERQTSESVPLQPLKSCVTGAWFASLAVQRVVNKTFLVYHVNERHIFPWIALSVSMFITWDHH